MLVRGRASCHRCLNLLERPRLSEHRQCGLFDPVLRPCEPVLGTEGARCESVALSSPIAASFCLAALVEASQQPVCIRLLIATSVCILMSFSLSVCFRYRVFCAFFPNLTIFRRVTMQSDLLPHAIDREFPELADKVHKLKVSDAHFHRLLVEHDELDASIIKDETGVAPMSDMTLEDMKKRRLHLKDELYRMASAA
jgi:uncharacterized protein